MGTTETGNWPRLMDPERRRFWTDESYASEVIPEPGMKVEKVIASPRGVSLVRKPEPGVLPGVAGGMSGTRAAMVGKPEAVVYPAM